MKKKLIVICSFILLFSTSSHSQVKHEIGVIYGKSSGAAVYSILRNGFLVGGSTSSLEKNNTIGIKYIRSIQTKKKLKLELGLNYLNGTLKITPAPTGDPVYDAPSYGDFMLISSPVYINYSFWKYFFLNTGVLLDYQKSESETYSGIGIGYGFGLSARYSYKKYFFFINPKYEKHLFFSKSDGLMEFGIMSGIGYTF